MRECGRKRTWVFSPDFKSVYIIKDKLLWDRV